MQSVGSDYQYGSDLIGHGAFAIVYKGWHKPSSKAVAIKQILLKNIPGKMSSMRQKEISILKELKHPNVVQLYDCYETKVELYIIMEFCNGGDLADYLHAKKTLSEESIKHLSIHVASALVFIQQHHIIHRDIKPQNILLSFTNPSSSTKQFKDASIKIADFGFARYLYEADMAATVCGSPIYMAPEILIGHKYDSKVDMWSTGVIIYQCLTGSTPFQASDPHSLRKQYIRNTLKPRIPMGVSSLLTDLLLKLIVKSPQDRMSQVEFKSHSFLKAPPEESLSLESSPSLHARSSPVPINRPDNNEVVSSRNSPHSGRRGSFGSIKGFSGSSGPPSIHRIVTNPSLHKYYSSPPTNVTDEGFILVGTPGANQYQHVSPSPCSVSSSSKSSTSPIGSFPRHSYLIQSPRSPDPAAGRPYDSPMGHSPNPTVAPTSSTYHSVLSHTPPFSSLFRAGQSQTSLKHHYGNNNSGNSPIDTSPQLINNYFSSLPGKQSFPGSRSGSIPGSCSGSLPGSRPGSLPAGSVPGSRPGSLPKLSTLVESKHESVAKVGGSDNHMVDSMDMITPSLLMESDVLRNELERLSGSGGGASEGNMLNLLMSIPNEGIESPPTASGGGPRRVSKGLDLSQELADIRKKDMSLNQKRAALFSIGDSSGSSSPQFSSSSIGNSRELLLDKWSLLKNEVGGGESSSSSDYSPTSPVTEEMFTLQLDEGNQDKPLQSLKKDIVLANELLRIAKTRQGPMLLLSSSMGDSGGMVDHVVRFSEQLVLCAKAATVIRDGVTKYHISNAVSSMDTSESHKEVLEDANKLQSLCLEKARLARDLYHKCLAKRRRHSLSNVSVTAEKLIFFQAIDLCKQALLEERQNKKDDCLRKYRLVEMLLNLLLSDANSPNDRSIIEKYIDSVRSRQRTQTPTTISQ